MPCQLTLRFKLDAADGRDGWLTQGSYGLPYPGEKTMYEVQRLENAAARIFQTKITQFEEQILEPMLNAMLEMARRKLDLPPSASSILLSTLSSSRALRRKTRGSGFIRPMAARNFRQKAEVVQN